MNGDAFESEMPATAFAPVPMPAAIKDLSKAKVMLITDGGLVPKGNPDRIEGTAATRWGSYNIEGSDDLRGEDYEVSHGGYDTRFVQEDPDRLVPLDALREMEKNGVIGKLHGEFLSTCGRSNPLSNTRRLGREMAAKIKREGVDCGHSHLHVRHQHSQRRCDHDRTRESRHPGRANHRGSSRSPRWSAPTASFWAPASCTSPAMPNCRWRKKKTCGENWSRKRWTRCNRTRSSNSWARFIAPLFAR